MLTKRIVSNNSFSPVLGHAAAIHGLCITPSEFESRLGEFSYFCPVNLADNILVDCSKEQTLTYSAEYRLAVPLFPPC